MMSSSIAIAINARFCIADKAIPNTPWRMLRHSVPRKDGKLDE